MKKAILALGLVSAMVFTVNALILTGHLSPDRFVSGPRASSLAEAGTGQNDMHAALPQTPDLDGTGHSAPLPAGIEDSQDGDLDAPRLKLASTGPTDPIADNSEIAAIGTSTAVVRSGPSASSAPLFAFPLGRRVRVGERENGFARIEDIASGELGWVEEAALGPDQPQVQRRKRDSYAAATVDQPAVSKPREKGRWARKGGRRGGLFGRLIGRR